MMLLGLSSGKSCKCCLASYGGRRWAIRRARVRGDAPLTRPAGDLSPRGEETMTVRTMQIAKAHATTYRPRPRGERVGVRGRMLCRLYCRCHLARSLANDICGTIVPHAVFLFPTDRRPLARQAPRRDSPTFGIGEVIMIGIALV